MVRVLGCRPVPSPLTFLLATPKRQRGQRAQRARAAAAAAIAAAPTTATSTAAAPTAVALPVAASLAAASPAATPTAAAPTATPTITTKCGARAKDRSVVPFVLDVAAASMGQGGKNIWLYFCFQLFNSFFSAATPKRQSGRRAQQAQAVTLTTASVTTTTVATTLTPSAMANTTGTAAGNDDPFLASSPYSKAQQLRIRSPDSQSDASSTSDASAICRNRRKDAQDVKTFFREQNGRSYCKFCE